MAVEYNRQLLSTYFKFIPGSKLKLFIEKRRVGITPPPLMYSLCEVCTHCWLTVFFVFTAFFFFLSLDPNLLVTNHKERIDV